jgi:hypothetical protein
MSESHWVTALVCLRSCAYLTFLSSLCYVAPHRHQATPPALTPAPGHKEGDDLPPAPSPQSEEGEGVSTWGVMRRIIPSLRVQFVLAALSFGAVPALVPQACQAYQHQARVLQYRYMHTTPTLKRDTCLWAGKTPFVVFTK